MFFQGKQKSPIAWLGGKSRLAAEIVQRMPEHHTYCEPFCGAAWVFFHKQESRVEVLNDINRDLVNLFRCIKHHLPALVEQFKWMLVAREQFDVFMATPAETLTDIQRAARFYYLNKTAFGAKVKSPTFGVAASQPPRLNLLRIEEDFSAAHLRLHRVQIENRPYAQVIDRIDRPDTLFYIDPPYWDCESDYGTGIFSKADFSALAAQLADIKGKFILSLNDTPGVREVFSVFQFTDVRTRYSISAAAKREVGEVLISNFTPAWQWPRDGAI